MRKSINLVGFIVVVLAILSMGSASNVFAVMVDDTAGSSSSGGGYGSVSGSVIISQNYPVTMSQVSDVGNVTLNANALLWEDSVSFDFGALFKQDYANDLYFSHSDSDLNLNKYSNYDGTITVDVTSYYSVNVSNTFVPMMTTFGQGGWADFIGDLQGVSYSQGLYVEPYSYTEMVPIDDEEFTSIEILTNDIWASSSHTLNFDPKRFSASVTDLSLNSFSSENQYQEWYDVKFGGSVIFTPIPEPATLAFLGIGSVAVLRRKK